VPFGVNIQTFSPANQINAQRELGINPGSIVIAFRATQSQFKGMSYIIDCLRRIKSKSPICILTFDTRGLVDEFRGRFQIVELGWINDEKLTVQALNACDIFLMPSRAEAFGMMAMEAMACAKPVVVFDNTSLPEVVFAPNGGVAVPYCDIDALVSAVQKLIDDRTFREKLGSEARKLACEHYNFDDHFRKILEVYGEVLNRRNNQYH
jgi:glycosyltransferase involved in cell wall biosynthesis